MQDIPKDIMASFMERLKRSNIPASYHAEYLQWLRYYLDFAASYPMPDSNGASFRAIVEKNVADQGIISLQVLIKCVNMRHATTDQYHALTPWFQPPHLAQKTSFRSTKTR